jgi:hypothetical protein
LCTRRREDSNFFALCMLSNNDANNRHGYGTGPVIYMNFGFPLFLALAGFSTFPSQVRSGFRRIHTSYFLPNPICSASDAGITSIVFSVFFFQSGVMICLIVVRRKLPSSSHSSCISIRVLSPTFFSDVVYSFCGGAQPLPWYAARTTFTPGAGATYDPGVVVGFPLAPTPAPASGAEVGTVSVSIAAGVSAGSFIVVAGLDFVVGVIVVEGEGDDGTSVVDVLAVVSGDDVVAGLLLLVFFAASAVLVVLVTG